MEENQTFDLRRTLLETEVPDEDVQEIISEVRVRLNPNEQQDFDSLLKTDKGLLDIVEHIEHTIRTISGMILIPDETAEIKQQNTKMMLEFFNQKKPSIPLLNKINRTIIKITIEPNSDFSKAIPSEHWDDFKSRMNILLGK